MVRKTFTQCMQTICLLTVLTALPLSSTAMHEADHRYTVYGEVRDTTGSLVVNEQVMVVGENGQSIGEGVTDSDGRYRIKLHLHDSDLGLLISFTVRHTTLEATVTFDPSNPRAERFLQIDILNVDSR